MSWEKVRLEDICISITDGDHQSLPLAERGIPFIVIANINSTNRIEFEKTRYVPIDYYEKLDEKRKPSKGDVLLTVKGSFGIPVYVDTDSPFVFQRDIAIFKCNEKVNSMFLFYYMKTREFYLYADSVAIGAAQRALTLKLLKNTIVTIPSLEKQDKIVELLAPYDKLISNNQKQIKLLEEAAQRLYKEWFVDFRFPGYEDVKIVDGVPEGWRKQKISDFGEIITGKTPSTAKEQYYGGNIPFVKIPDMHDCVYPIITESTLTSEGANTQKNKFIPKNGIMVSCIATVGLVNIAVESCQTNQQINSIILNDEQDLYYTYSTMKILKTLLEGVGSNGATMINVNKTKFGNLEVLYPTDEFRKMYYDFCQPIFEKIYALSISINKLSLARDLLLPKLMNGEIEVKYGKTKL